MKKIRRKLKELFKVNEVTIKPTITNGKVILKGSLESTKKNKKIY